MLSKIRYHLTSYRRDKMDENKYYENFKSRVDANEKFEQLLEEVYEDVSRNIIKVATYMKCIKYLNEGD